MLWLHHHLELRMMLRLHILLHQLGRPIDIGGDYRAHDLKLWRLCARRVLSCTRRWLWTLRMILLMGLMRLTGWWGRRWWCGRKILQLLWLRLGIVCVHSDLFVNLDWLIDGVYKFMQRIDVNGEKKEKTTEKTQRKIYYYCGFSIINYLYIMWIAYF